MGDRNNRILIEGSLLNARYCIRTCIRVEEYGITYLAVDYLTDSYVAIKEFFLADIMNRNSTMSSEITIDDSVEAEIEYARCHENFMREIEILKYLKDVPYIERYRDSFEQNNTVYIVLEYFDGKSLNEIRHERDGFSASALFVYMEKVMTGLKQMHKMGIIHRDICPDNLILDSNDDLLLINFEAAIATDPSSPYYSTQPLMVRDFESPERAFTELQGAYTDIYSLCATIFYLLTGEIPPTAQERISHDTVPSSLQKLFMSMDQQNILIKGLEIVRNERYQTMDELMDHLYGEVPTSSFNAFEVSYELRSSVGDRKNNQDNFIFDLMETYEGKNMTRSGVLECHTDHIYMAAICDGVGGAKYGELASQKVAETLYQFLKEHRMSHELPRKLLEEAVCKANDIVIALADMIGPTASTLSLLMWKNDEYYIVNVGDSPIYYLSHNQIKRLSVPHTKHDLYEKMHAKPLKQDEHTMINYMGRKNIPVEHMMNYRHGKIYKDDVFLLCSDGISDKINEAQMQRVLSRYGTKSLSHFYQMLEFGMNNDNSTAIVVKF